MSSPLYYVYPMWHTVSFTLVAKKHIEYLTKLGVKVYEVDELAFPNLVPHTRPVALVHPMFYCLHRVLQIRGKYFSWWRSKYRALIGIDVADSDRISQLAVNIANLCDACIVPSNFAREVYIKSGVKVPVYRVPHGVDPDWYTMPNIWESAPARSIHPAILQIFLYKVRKQKKIILFWLWHSGERKGWTEVREFYARLRKERNDVVLVLKTGIPNPAEYQQVMHLGAINIYGWLSEYDKMALYDLADLVLVFSRGGGFELNALEALARGVPTLTTDWGCFLDYVPDFLRCKRGKKVVVLPGNQIHVGYGYAVDVEDAVNKAHQILDNLDEYRAKVLEWRDKVLAREYRWDIVARKLLDVVREVEARVS